MILVIGDAILDQYSHGTVTRISPEAPVPVVRHLYSEYRLGGAANVAHNAVALGAQTHLIARIGNDEDGTRLMHLLNQHAIMHTLIQTDALTIKKTRIMSRNQQLLRIDMHDAPVSCEIPDAILTTLSPTVIILSDYAKGVVSPDLCRALIQDSQVPVIVDPKRSKWDIYAGCFMITPNLDEFSRAINQDIPNTDAAIECHGPRLRRNYHLDNLLITRSEAGMSLVTETGCQHFPIVKESVIDVSGAGDTVVAAIATGLDRGDTLDQAIRLANQAAKFVVKKVGTAVVDPHEREVMQ